MLPENLVHELRSLSRADKLRAMQLLITQLAVDEASYTLDASYELLTPYGNEAAAQVLAEFLKASKDSV